jgi:hypothetical protein
MGAGAASSWILAAMRPIAELCPGEQAHLFARGLALAHLDATLRRSEAAARFLAGDLEAELASRGVEAITHRPSAFSNSGDVMPTPR